MKRLLCLAFALLVAGSVRSQEIARGAFLVAQPTLTEAAFRRTVILITQRPDGGALGVILNRPAEVTLREAFPRHPAIAAQPQMLYLGGAVQPQSLLFLLRSATPPPRGIPVLSDVYLTDDADWVDRALASEKGVSALRAFGGHAEWAPGQLRSEMDQGWYLLPADAETLFEQKPDALWMELMKRAVLRPTLY